MNAETLLPWGLSVALLTIRLTVAVALSPALSAYGVPGAVRVAMTLALAYLTFAFRDPAPAATVWAADPAELLTAVLAEVFIGALLGLGVHVVLAALALAGRLLDVQVGFAIGSVFDPVTGASANVLGSLASLVGVTLFFVSDAHLQLTAMIARSIDVFPLGEAPAIQDPMQVLVSSGAMFTLGVAFAAPVALALLFTDLAIGVASRNMPQVNVLILAIPVKVVVGYLALAGAVVGWAPLLQQGFARMGGVLETR